MSETCENCGNDPVEVLQQENELACQTTRAEELELENTRLREAIAEKDKRIGELERSKRMFPIQSEEGAKPHPIQIPWSIAELALDHKAAGTLPNFIQDAAECNRCQFKGIVCDPPLATGEGAQIFTDPELEAKLLRYIEIEAIGEEYEALDKSIKEQFRGVEIGIAGSVLIHGKWQKNTTYPIPEDVKKRIEFLRSAFKKEDPKGKFIITGITKIS